MPYPLLRRDDTTDVSYAITLEFEEGSDRNFTMKGRAIEAKEAHSFRHAQIVYKRERTG